MYFPKRSLKPILVEPLGGPITLFDRGRNGEYRVRLDTGDNSLAVFARKPAPIQITWLDYVSTTGLAAMDYLLADPRQVPPEAEPYYREKVLRMPDDYICFDPPSEPLPVGPPPGMFGR